MATTTLAPFDPARLAAQYAAQSEAQLLANLAAARRLAHLGPDTNAGRILSILETESATRGLTA